MMTKERFKEIFETRTDNIDGKEIIVNKNLRLKR
jgi:hypothetical protein